MSVRCRHRKGKTITQKNNNKKKKPKKKQKQNKKDTPPKKPQTNKQTKLKQQYLAIYRE